MQNPRHPNFQIFSEKNTFIIKENTDQVTLLSYTTLTNLPAKIGCPKSGGVQQETDADVVGDYSANTSCEADPSSLGISEYTEGEIVFAYHGPHIHDAKVLKVKMQKVDDTEEKRYFIHYLVSAMRKHEVHEAKKGASKDGRTKRRKSSIASLAALSTPSRTDQGVPLVSNDLGSTAQFSGQSRRTFMFEQLVERDSLIGCGGYVLVYDFWVPPEHEAVYTEIVKNHGHIPTMEVLPEMNTLVSLTRSLLQIADDKTKAEQVPPSAEKLKGWGKVIASAQRLNFNVNWMEVLLKEFETKVNARRARLPSVIAKLRRNLVLLRVEAQAHAAIQERLVAEVAEVATKANVTNAAIVTNEKLLREAEEELAATQ
ncbi:uncharacterized protein LOC113315415 [Papaver somniferum]|uniref:uncharacterized protein LOC113315415 n=1 Tax=Papaver somniferum TaxID=3469 RepID=UPI000E70477C|nr:uncharacterized protein LOC113315415 [Papaver somniferum]